MSDDDHVIPVILAIFERYRGTKTHLNIALTPPPPLSSSFSSYSSLSGLSDPSLSVEQILLELTHHNKLQNLPRKRIEYILQVLVERNAIYPVGESHYRRIL